MNKCEWCGNESGKTDSRGMCISCGGNLSKPEIKNAWDKWIANEWIDHSGSSYDIYSWEKIYPEIETLRLVGKSRKLSFA